MGRIGLLCAVEQEFAALLSAFDPAPFRREVAGFVILAGHIDGVSVALTPSGIGKVRAAMASSMLLREFGCGALMMSGVAGALDPELEVGDVVLADRVAQHDAGLWVDGEFSPYQAGHVPFFNPTDRFGWSPSADLFGAIETRLRDIDLEEGAGGRAPIVRRGLVLSGDQFVACEATRKRLRADFGGMAIDMESAAVAQVAAAAGVEFMVVRAISDCAGSKSDMDFAAFSTQVAPRAARITRATLPILAERATPMAAEPLAFG